MLFRSVGSPVIFTAVTEAIALYTILVMDELMQMDWLVVEAGDASDRFDP